MGTMAQKQVSILQVYRSKELHQRLLRQLGRKPLNSGKKGVKLDPSFPKFPWSFPVSLQVKASGVHQLENRDEVRGLLKLDKILSAFCIIDDNSVKIFVNDGQDEEDFKAGKNRTYNEPF